MAKNRPPGITEALIDGFAILPRKTLPGNGRPVTEFDLDDKPEPVANVVDEDFFSGDDAVGTKLDLAKAYLDMGDPEGARSMLQEVLAEGNDTQKGEAKRLLADIG